MPRKSNKHIKRFRSPSMYYNYRYRSLPFPAAEMFGETGSRVLRLDNGSRFGAHQRAQLIEGLEPNAMLSCHRRRCLSSSKFVSVGKVEREQLRPNHG